MQMTPADVDAVFAGVLRFFDQVEARFDEMSPMLRQSFGREDVLYQEWCSFREVFE